MSNPTPDLNLLLTRLRALHDDLERTRERERLRVEEVERRIGAAAIDPPRTEEAMHELFQAYEARSFARGRLDALDHLIERLDLLLAPFPEGSGRR
ncbi:MAG: hypothetical protein DIU58_000255 [Sphaerobacter thermophilus]|jgi:hypothetical protein|uniref:hypothetical protein n=1 Tax=Sphaerobacter thermophilus TaxID=2057 RepID=UPI00396EDA56